MDDYGIIQLILFVWQLYGLLLIWRDPTLSMDLKFLGTIINLSFFFYIYTQVAKQVWNMLNWAVGTMLLIWYIYYVPFDYNNPGYSPIAKFVYVSIDIFSIFYLGYTLTTNVFAKLGNKIKIKIHIQINEIKSALLGTKVLLILSKIKSLFIGKA